MKTTTHQPSTLVGEQNADTPATYTARFRDDGAVIYARRPCGNLFGELPLGSVPIKYAIGEDPWNGAQFLTAGTGRTIEVLRDPSAKLEPTLEKWTRNVDTVWTPGGEIVCHPINSADAIRRAMLIEQAPALLAIAKRIARHCEQHNAPELQGIACEAFAAIAATEGRQP